MNPRSFLAAIREDPADDVPRLVFADWLDDGGEYDRAEFIRAQCEVARGVRDRGRSLELRARLAELARCHRAAWLGSLQALAPDAIFERGFVDHIRISASLFLEHAEAIFDAHPIRHVRLERAHRVLGELLACPYLADLDSLDFQSEPLGDDGLMLLGRCPHLGRLRSLDLSRNRCSAVGVGGLLADGAVAGLESLTLSHNPLGNAGVAEVVREQRLPRLRQLDLSATGIDHAGADLLAGSATLGQLRFLRLEANLLGLPAIERLAESSHLRQLEVLAVRFCGVGEAGAALSQRLGARVML